MTNSEAARIIDQYDCNFYWTDGEKIPAKDLIEAFDLAVKALEEQEPQEPHYYDADDSWGCGNCGETVGYGEYNLLGLSPVKDKYCKECGKKVQWI